MRIICTLLIAALAGAVAAEELQQRVELDKRALQDLMQAERWAMMDAQKYAAKGEHRRAAVEFEKFTTTFPDSELWAFAVYSGCWHLYRDRRYEAATTRLREMIDIGEGAPEIPEAMLLLGRVRLAAGDPKDALSVLRELVDEHQGSTAEIPARTLASRALVEQARMTNRSVQDVASARIALLAPLGEEIVVDELNGPDLMDGLDQLAKLTLRSQDYDRLLALLEGMFAARIEAKRSNLGSVRYHLVRDTMSLATNHGQDGIVEQVAAIAWQHPGWRLRGLADFHLDWSHHVARRLDDVASKRGVPPEELEAWIEERTLAFVDKVGKRVEAESDAKLRGELGWLLARLHLRSGASWGAAEAAIDTGFAGEWNGEKAYDAFQFAVRHDVEADTASSVAARVDDEGQRQQVLLRILEYRAKKLHDKEAAEQAIVILQGMAEEARNHDQGIRHLYRVASLQEEPLHAWDDAITTYETINQPPRTDFAIAECLGRKGAWKEAFNRYGSIYAMEPKKGNGAKALLQMGRIANERLNDRVRSIKLLRQVCDDFPNSGYYSNAHTYLQHKLGVTYTGGGGGKKAQR